MLESFELDTGNSKLLESVNERIAQIGSFEAAPVPSFSKGSGENGKKYVLARATKILASFII